MSWAQVPTFLRDKQGRTYLNPAKDWVQPFELSVSKPNQVITLAAGERRGPFPLTAQYDGPIEVFYVKVVVYDDTDTPVTDYDIDFLLEHPGKRIQFSPRMVPLLACSGDGGRPYVLPETIFIPPVQSLNITLRNRDLVNERRVEIVLGGIKFYPNQAPGMIKKEVWEYIERRERTYAYLNTTDEEIVLPAGATDDPNFMTIPDNADFECFKLTAQSTAPFRCRIRDGQNDRALTGDKIHSSLLFGAHQVTAAGGGVGGSGGIFPARWATSWMIRRSLKVQLDIDNLDTVNPNTVKPVFGGRKVSYVS
ncbi:MAG: hypothetical protein ACREDF_09590 [Thermoplasmata archaeon]